MHTALDVMTSAAAFNRQASPTARRAGARAARASRRGSAI
jgi:hypothetical protein